MASMGSVPEGLVGLLGGRKVLGPLTEARDIQEAVRDGLPYATLGALAMALDLAQKDVTAVIGVAPRTLARRRHERQFSPAESDRLYRIAHVTRLAVDVLGSLDKARKWLTRENRALGGAIPLGMLDTEIGERQVEDVLLRLAHGIYG